MTTTATRPQSLSATSIEGTSVHNHSDEDLGHIKDLMIDVGAGFVRYAVLSYGGILGLGDKLFAVPWSALSVDTDAKCLRLDESKDRLQDAPGFDKDDWPNFADPTFGSTVSSYYRQPVGGTNPTVLSSGSLIGDGVTNPEGEDLGKIQDLMIDLSHGRISYAVISFGGILGFGDKYFAVPWGALQLSTERKKFFVGLPKEALEESDGFDKDDWPDFTNADWSRSVYRRYGVDPYWP